MTFVVYKLGGSLLSCCDLAVRLKAVLQQRPGSYPLIIVGGGSAANVVRAWSVTHTLTEVAAHWLAVRSLSLNRGLLRHLLPESHEVSSRDEFQRSEVHVPLLLDVEACLLAAETNHRCSLPKCWDMTTDSIAAWVAHDWGADELVLLKSTALPVEQPLGDGSLDDRPPQKQSLAAAAGRGFVDPHFPLVAWHVPRVSWCNLRENNSQIIPWLPLRLSD